MGFDLDACIAKLYKCEPLSEHAVKWICEKVKELLVTESNVLALSTPLTVVGDVHGCESTASYSPYF